MDPKYYREGYYAYSLENKSYDSNPYLKDSAEYKEWNLGYCAACSDGEYE